MTYEQGQNITAMIDDNFVYGIILAVGNSYIELLTPKGDYVYPLISNVIEVLTEDKLEEAAARYFHEVGMEK